MTLTRKLRLADEEKLGAEAERRYREIRSWRLVAREMGHSVGYIWKLANRKK